MKQLMFAMLLMLLGATSLSGDNTPQATPFLQSPDGKLREIPKKQPQFIVVDDHSEKLKDFGLVLHIGVATWTEAAGNAGRPAAVPVSLVYAQPEDKLVVEVATYYTGEDGRYYFVAPDDGTEYMFLVRTERAENMPEKARRHFEELKRQEQEDGVTWG